MIEFILLTAVSLVITLALLGYWEGIGTSSPLFWWALDLSFLLASTLSLISIIFVLNSGSSSLQIAGWILRDSLIAGDCNVLYIYTGDISVARVWITAVASL